MYSRNAKHINHTNQRSESKTQNRGESVRKVGPFLLTESTQRDHSRLEKLKSPSLLKSSKLFNYKLLHFTSQFQLIFVVNNYKSSVI